jgi:hypothetical protein
MISGGDPAVGAHTGSWKGYEKNPWSNAVASADSADW